MHMVQTAADAAQAARLGAAVIVAQGHEGGGHIGHVSTMPLVPAAVDAVARAVPDPAARPAVVAAGGIADGRGLVAALALGADGVLLGTRFLATREAPIHAAAKRAICAATEADTIAGLIPDLVSNPRWGGIGALARSLRTPAVLEWVGREEELRRMPEGERKALAARWTQARTEGKTDDASILAGEDSGLIDEVLPAGEVVRRVVGTAEEILRGLPGRVGAG
jgi:NAD(P)H-dependent flavin oxidoreductase YrpB (nitropropane dioxygenase family)